MVRQYNAKASDQGLEPSEMHATVGDLLDPAEPSSSISTTEFYGFDLAVLGFALHHFQDPVLAVTRLVERVKPGDGVLLVVDFLPHDPVPMAGHTVAHCGFGEREMVGLFEKAGCVDVRYVVLGKGCSVDLHGERHERGVFMCRGRRGR